MPNLGVECSPTSEKGGLGKGGTHGGKDPLEHWFDTKKHYSRFQFDLH